MSLASTSPLGRLPAGLKLVGLSLACFGVLLLNSLAALGIALVGLAALLLLARVPAAALWRQLRPIAWIVALALPLNAIWLGIERALLISGRLGVALSLAALFTLTTPVSAVLGSVDRATRRLLSAERADRLGLMIALVIRTIPLLEDLLRQATEARRARGAERSIRALATPLVVRAVKSADTLGDALLARGADD